MHTKDILAEELTKAGLSEMAMMARDGYYHDFLSPLAFPDMQLLVDLMEAGTQAAFALRARHLNGEFAASVKESDDWADSPEGEATFAQLLCPAKKK